MAKALVKHTIDERSYSFGRLPILRSVALILKITKLLGTSLKDGFNAGPEFEKLLDANYNIGTIISNLCEKLDPEMFNELAVEILSQTLYNAPPDSEENGGAKGGSINSEERIEIVFADTGIGHLLSVLQMALKVEYEGFFLEKLGLSGLIKKIKEKSSMIQASSTSSGSSGDPS